MRSPSSDRIRLTGIAATGYHGVYPFERAQGQRFVVDATLWLDLSDAVASDDLGHTVDYGELTANIRAIIEGQPVNLVETLAGRVVDVCLALPLVQEVEVSVHKPEAPLSGEVADVSVTLVREAG